MYASSRYLQETLTLYLRDINFCKKKISSKEIILYKQNYSFDEKIFKEAAIYYEDTLNKAGYIKKLVYYTPSASNQESKNKNR